MQASTARVPLVVDLDGTLLRSDTLVESAFGLVKQSPSRFLMPLIWLREGKARLKTRLAEEVDLDVSVFPYDEEFLKFLQSESARGRSLVLATATHERYARQIADHLGMFDDVLATTDHLNLSARHKAQALVERYGVEGFDYAGNSADDLPVWAAARNAIVVNPEPGVLIRANRHGNVARVFLSGDGTVRGWLKAIRVHQWLKNLLVFVPLLASHRVGELSLLFAGLVAFLSFGMCASSVYVLNDLLDLEDDRHHPAKRRRPFASGRVSVKAGLLVFPILLCGAFGSALAFLPSGFALALAVYYMLTLSYSLSLKRVVMLDVVALALLYTVRIIAGALAFGLALTYWMLAFSIFVFLSLALVKRYAELKLARDQGSAGKARGRGYYADDLEMVSSLGAASGYIAVLVLALYIQDSNTVRLYQHPEAIWLAVPILLYWMSRTWLLAHRGQMQDDPVVFAATDRVSLVVVVLLAVVFWVAA